ncbi:4-methyl-5(b-hydroxyethyl)-thiazole monophosphate biosynthesis [Parelusimicrobium proximum]|uniref:DJ-1 family glyoxalase III n=1 Tax=Parelusimicrobium proximum TaxID=3228953 RepID=UPI003D163C88
MSKAALFIIDGFEETEGICTADILRRGGVDITLVSLSGEMVRGKHSITVKADKLFKDIKEDNFGAIIIPGGTINYLKHDDFLKYVTEAYKKGLKLNAICAAPAVFGKLGLLQGKKAVCYPGMEEYLTGAYITDSLVETDGNITTSKGPGTTVHFALRILEILEGKEKADKTAKDFLAQI